MFFVLGIEIQRHQGKTLVLLHRNVCHRKNKLDLSVALPIAKSSRKHGTLSWPFQHNNVCTNFYFQQQQLLLWTNFAHNTNIMPNIFHGTECQRKYKHRSGQHLQAPPLNSPPHYQTVQGVVFFFLL